VGLPGKLSISGKRRRRRRRRMKRRMRRTL